MKAQSHGIISLGLIFAAVILAAIAIFRVSWVPGVIYLAVCGIASIALLYAYCAKCPCRDQCGHVFPGKMARIFKTRRPPYTIFELVVTGLILILFIGLPQIWLYRYFGLFIAFWVMIVIAVIEIRTVVCRVCSNTYCPGKNL
ncbi:MAG: hypothetical protein JW932_15030 [Deltaproteobacteria bacterium]|nr:hypothetical protein [Deltaproteobacteria bacterium]